MSKWHTCESCRHWLVGNDADLSDAQLVAGFGNCALGHSEKGNPTNLATLCYADDAESYIADMVTHRTFGCVQFGDKP